MTKEEFIDLFTVNPNAYAIQKASGDYSSIKDTLTPELFSQHAQGTLTLGSYCLNKDSMAKFVCIDVDQDDKEEVTKYLKACYSLGIHNPLIEFSGRKGYHIIIPFAGLVPGWKARALGHLITKDRSYAVEVYPLQDYITQDMIGSLIKVPLGIHRVSGIRSRFLTKDFTPLSFDAAIIEYLPEEHLDIMIKGFSFVKPRNIKEERKQYPCNDDLFQNIDKFKTPDISINTVAFFIACRLAGTGLPRLAAEKVLSDWVAGNNPQQLPHEKQPFLDKHLNSAYSGKYRLNCTNPHMVEHFCKKEECWWFNQINNKDESIDVIADELIPTMGIIKDYVEYARSRNSAPTQFHVMMALQLINIMIKDKVWFTGAAGQKVYTNLYTLFLGTSGAGKTTATDTGLKVLKAVDRSLIHPSDYASRLGFLEALSEEPQGLCVFNEFEVLLAKRSQGAHEGLLNDITNLYDFSEDLYEVKARSKEGKEETKVQPIVIHKPKLSIASSTTIEGLASYLKETDLRTGFFVRFGVLYTNQIPEYGFQPETDEIRAKFDSLVSHLKHFYDQIDEKEADFSEVKDDLDKFCKEMFTELRDDPHASLFSAFYSRLNIYLLKFAVLYQMSFDGSPIVGEYALTMAVKTVTYMKQTIRYVVTDKMNFGKFQQGVANIKEMIYNKGNYGIARSELLKLSKMSTREFDEAIKVLVQREEIAVKEIGSKEIFCKQ